MCITGSYGSMRSPSKSAWTSSSSKSYEQSLRIAIASSMPPSHESFFWKICMTTRGRQSGENVADGGRCNKRPDEMTATALVLLLGAVAVLVAADRDVLGAVVGSKLSPAQRQGRRCKRQEAREQLLCRGAQATRVAN